MRDRALASTLAAFVILAAACGGVGGKIAEDPDAGSCAADPWTCGPGKTCWAVTGPSDFQCLPAGPKQKGEPCAAIEGEAECGEAMMCFLTLVPGAAGTCVPYCDPGGDEHPCAAGEKCGAVEMKGSTTTVRVCVGSSALVDAGLD